YGLAVRRRTTTAGQVVAFSAGLAAVAVALLPPLDDAAAGSLTAHMAQHVILLAVAAPLLALGVPVPSPERGWAWWAAGALVVQSVVMWAWHAPAPYEAALRHQPLHALEHASFLVSATALWWAIGLRRRRGTAVP